MAKAKNIEPSINVKLANVLRKKYPEWQGSVGSEQTQVLEETRKRPDIVVKVPKMMPVILETEIAPAPTVEADAKARLGKHLRATGDRIETVIAIKLKQNLATVDEAKIESELVRTTYQYCCFTENEDGPVRYPKSGWLKGTVDNLARAVELAQLSENRIEAGTKTMELGVEQATVKLHQNLPGKSNSKLKEIGKKLKQEASEQTSRMAMAIVLNALSFQSAIAHEHDIETLSELKVTKGKISKAKLLECWRRILEEINYWPIFKIASDVIMPIPESTANEILTNLCDVADKLAHLGATTQHELCGRIFQRLITDRKFLATYYTLPTSALLLAELAIRQMDVDWSDKEQITGIRIADFACGTGTLLSTAYDAILARYRRAGENDQQIHAQMMERVLIGTDIMPAATHLTASMLASAHPGVTFSDTRIVTLPYGNLIEGRQKDGRAERATGALEFLAEEQQISLFGTGRVGISGDSQEAIDDGTVRGEKAWTEIKHQSIDLVIMNPPFTRPTNHEITDKPIPSFAAFDMSEKQQNDMSRRLKTLRKQLENPAGHGNAGLASNFLDLADKKLKTGGILAMVLPASFIRGAAWNSARNLLAQNYGNVQIISISTDGPDKGAFSADTHMAEALLIAKKTGEGNGRALFVNLKRRPENLLEALSIASAHNHQRSKWASGNMQLGKEKISHWIDSRIVDGGWSGIKRVDVGNCACELTRGLLTLPRITETWELPVCRIEEIGRRGPLGRDIIVGVENDQGGYRGPLVVNDIQPDETPTWPILWAHDANREKFLTVEPDKEGVPQTGKERDAEKLWNEAAARLHCNIDFRINSQPLAACLTPEFSLGGRAWPTIKTKTIWEKTLALWMNTTLGLIQFWWQGTRQQSGRCSLSISRIPDLHVLDPRALDSSELEKADRIFDRLTTKPLLPANEAYKDDTRQELDREILTSLLDLPDQILEPLNLLRRQWCEEPSVHGGKTTKPS